METETWAPTSSITGLTRSIHFGPRALVVEDDRWMEPLITTALKAAIPGVRIEWVETVEEALGRTRYRQYSVIVADIQLKPGEETGLDLWRFCQAECPEVPMLLTSSTPIDTFQNQMGDHGPHYLCKPFNISECKEVIRNLVSYTSLTS